MNDRYKFRAWDGERMYHGMKCLEWMAWQPESVTLMQSTGLKDKNGQLIYEGDIVKWTSTHSVIGEAKEHIDAVVWEQHYVCYMLMPWAHELNHARMVIIGNIHQHPELLETK